MHYSNIYLTFLMVPSTFEKVTVYLFYLVQQENKFH